MQWQRYLICYVKLMFLGWLLNSWVMHWIELIVEFMTPFICQNKLYINLIGFPVISFTLTWRFCSRGKRRKSILFFFNDLMIMVTAGLLFYYYHHYYFFSRGKCINLAHFPVPSLRSKKNPPWKPSFFLQKIPP